MVTEALHDAGDFGSLVVGVGRGKVSGMEWLWYVAWTAFQSDGRLLSGASGKLIVVAGLSG